MYILKNLLSLLIFICQTTPYIRRLNLSHCVIRAAYPDLRQANLDLRGCGDLQVVDISTLQVNHFKTLIARNIGFDKISKENIAQFKNTGRKMSAELDFSDNLWDCGCDEQSIASIEFMQTAKSYNITIVGFERYQCRQYFGGYSLLSHVDIAGLKLQCHFPKLMVALQTLIPIVCTVVAGTVMLLCYRCRYRIYNRCFRLCQRVHQNKAKTNLS